MDLVRDILISVADDNRKTLEKYADREVCYHMAIMIEAGLIIGEAIKSDAEALPVFAHADRLTWKGHDFLDAARHEERWSWAKKAIEKLGGATFQVWTALLTSYLQDKLGLK
jgi:hypothetical protein